ncbi:MAG: phosphoenolpyruvate--protein phosphotransferase [Gemmataceae bacterium]
MKKGVPVSPGVAVAQAHCVDEVITSHEPYMVDNSHVAAEISRFERACGAVIRELDDTISRVAKQIGEDEASIFRAHRQLLRDPTLQNKVKSRIDEEKVDAATALHATLQEYSVLFQTIPDAYFQERLADLRDVVGRVISQLSTDTRHHPIEFKEPVILVVSEIYPSQAAMIDKRWVAGIVTETGAATGHAAILARSLGLPAVSGLRGILREVRSGDLIAIDGREGHVYINPSTEVETAYRKLAREYIDVCHRLIENHHLESVSPDGTRVQLLANISGTADAQMAGLTGATGVGLYRTEYLFLTHPSVPNEEEQYQSYREVIEASPHKSVTIRTLDLGGDKHVSYLGTRKEANPFMGFRSIRLSSAYPEFFQAQLRAILRAGLHGNVSLLFPMISQLEEVQRIKRVVHRTKLALKRDGVPFAEQVPLGIMIEVPAAALCIDELLEEVDFVSIGSNDLIQYLMAADRDNPQVAHLCEPFGPAILRLLNRVIQACREHNKPVTLCGEMAGWPRCFLPLFGMGLRRLSMSPAAVPTIKELLRLTPLHVAEEVAQRVLAMSSTGEIRGFLYRKVKEIWPNVNLIDMRR